MMKKKKLTYKDVGVDIDTGHMFVNRIRNITKKTYRPEIISELGAFSALCRIPKQYHDPVLVSTTDGVGTKLSLAIDLNFHHSIGIDLVAMCVNDIITRGAEPLFFLDYFSSNKLNVDIAVNVIRGIAEGCLQSGCSLVGGETAEMPKIYYGENYDIVGFCVGIVERSKIIDNKKVVDGDSLIALSSNGLHSNGYSLVRKIIEISNCDILVTELENKPIVHHLLTPTRIYVKNILELCDHFDIHAISHITGGGLVDNISRVLPDDTQAIINQSSWKWPEIFRWIQHIGHIELYEMYRIFNCGIGMVVILPDDQANRSIKLMNINGEKAWKIGTIKSNVSTSSDRIVFV